jgi:hypothetical protein
MLRSARHTLLLLCTVVLGLGKAQGQTPNFVLNGVVKSKDTRMVMPGTTIIAKDTLTKSEVAYRVSTLSDRRGKYKLSLPYDGVYTVEYQAQGHVTKRLVIDLTNTRQKDREGGHAMSLEVVIFPQHGQVDYSAFDQPVAVCRFDRKQKKFAWDEEYSKDRQDELEAVNRTQEEAVRYGRNHVEQPAQGAPTPVH